MAERLGDVVDGLARASVELLLELFGATGAAAVSESASLPAYVHCKSAAAAARVRDRSGVRPADSSPSGRVRVTAGSALLRALLTSPDVRAMSLVERLSPSMNFAAAICTVPEFKQATGLTGKGVLIAIVDSGVDASSPMLEGQVALIWDQTASGPPSGGVPFGKILAPAGFSESSDSVGHGTHVAGIAAGRDPVFGGIAEGAELIIVKSNLDDADVEQALYWLQSIATIMQRPMVVNLSMEGRTDPHDGSGSLCETIDSLSGPGFIVCCASGNTGGEPDHTDVELASGSSMAIPCELTAAANATRVILKAWADPSAELNLALTAPDGQRWDVPKRSASGERQFVATQVLADALVDVVLPKAEAAFNDAIGFAVALQARGDAPIDGTWMLHISNSGSRPECVHLWSSPAEALRFRADTATDRVKIGAPGAAVRAITVGALVTRVAWLDDRQQLQVIEGQHRFQTALFSSPGPLRSGHEKPDLVAPGAHICSARSSAAQVPLGYAVSQHYRMFGGSSMATPFVAGIVALMLEANKSLTPEEAKQQLYGICAIPGHARGAYDIRWGYGLPDLILL
jgi:subtilisin family serine protease